MATTPENSKHTGIKARIDTLKNKSPLKSSLEQFVGSKPEVHGLPFLLKDYIELVDWTGRIIRKDKRGAISQDQPPIIERLSFDAESWLILTTQFEQQFGQWVGSEHIVREIYSDKQYQRIPKTDKQRLLLG